jgi:hypothetical protein
MMPFQEPLTNMLLMIIGKEWFKLLNRATMPAAT